MILLYHHMKRKFLFLKQILCKCSECCQLGLYIHLWSMEITFAKSRCLGLWIYIKNKLYNIKCFPFPVCNLGCVSSFKVAQITYPKYEQLSDGTVSTYNKFQDFFQNKIITYNSLANGELSGCELAFQASLWLKLSLCHWIVLDRA